jgi:N-acetylmuramoyl-L-alanine amidase
MWRKLMARLALAMALVAAGFTAQSKAAFETARVDGVKCIDAVALGEGFGLHASWTEPGKRLLLQNATTRVEFEVNQREAIFDGRHVFLGNLPVYHQRSIWISWIDTETLLAPLLRLGRDRPLPVHTIVIDPGHGIPDNGAENKHLGLKERELTLDTAFCLKKILELQGYKVVLTRTTNFGISPDKKLDLRRRDEIAAEVKADLFISIHFNSAGQYVPGENVGAVHGTETFRFTPRYQIPVSRSVHKAEDDDINPGNKYDQWNALLGYCIHRALLDGIGSYDRGLRHDNLAVLRLAPCPAVLVESGYLTNDAEARKLATPAYRQQIAEAIANGVRAYASLGPPPPAPAAVNAVSPPATVKPASPPVTTKPVAAPPSAGIPSPLPAQK